MSGATIFFKSLNKIIDFKGNERCGGASKIRFLHFYAEILWIYVIVRFLFGGQFVLKQKKYACGS